MDSPGLVTDRAGTSSPSKPSRHTGVKPVLGCFYNKV